MAAGVSQPGGAGTTIFVYDNTHGDAGGDGAYSMEDIKVAMDLIRTGQIEYLAGAVTGNVFSVSRKQYLMNCSIQFGGTAGDGNALTTWKDTGIDVYVRSGAILHRLGAGPIQTMLGTKVGVGPTGLALPTMGGINGVNIYGGAFTLRDDAWIYGCRFNLTGTLQIIGTGAVTQEFAGNSFMLGGTNNVLGDSTSVGDYFNNEFMFSTTANAINGIRTHASRGNKFFASAPLQIVASSQGTMRMEDALLAGSPTVAGFKPTATVYSDWRVCDITYADDSPRWAFNADATPDNGAEDYRRFNTRVGSGGVALAGIPVRLVSSVDGTVVDSVTFGAGDLGFVNGVTGYQNAILVRDYYRAAGVLAVRDRTFTLYVNMPGGAYPVNPAYGGKVSVQSWPGRDVFKGIYQADGGTFVTWVETVDLPAAIGPTAGFGVQPGGGFAPLSVQFTDESVAGDAAITARAWDFGDGGASALQSPAHVYASPGLFTVKLTVTTAVGISVKTRVAAVFADAGDPTTNYREGDIDLALAEFGQDVTFGGFVAKGIVNRKTVTVVEGLASAALGQEVKILIKTGSLPGLAVKSLIVADGITYHVTDLRRVDEGLATEISVALEG